MNKEKQNLMFSIVIPTFNRAHMISRTLDTILLQPYTNFEIIIVDDGSTDNTEELIKSKYEGKVRYYKKKNEERSAARNFGTKNAKGKYVIWFDSDDIMYSNYLELANESINAYKHPEVIAFSYSRLNEKEEVLMDRILPAEVNKALYKGNCLSGNSVIVRRNIALKNPFNTELNAGEDYELWLRLASQYKINSSKTITSGVILHDERSVKTMSTSEKLIERFEKFLKHTTQNEKVMNYLGSDASCFIMKNYLILAVELSVNNHKKEAIKFLAKAVKSDRKALVNKTFYATLKHLIL